MEEDDVRLAVQAIRPYLPELVGSEAPHLKRELDGLLSKADAGEPIKRPALTLLRKRRSTREWADRLLATPVELRLFAPIPGSLQQVRVPRYVCPKIGCTTVWFRFSASEKVPDCEQHRIRLVVAPPG